ncbi:MAG: hypothetical protein WC519_00100 [Parcubacteria group bacterium]
MDVKLPFTLKLVPTGFDTDKTKDGWKLVENEPFDIPAKIGKLRLDLVQILYKKELSIPGETLKIRAKYLKVHHGQRFAELLLRNQSQIPDEWGKYSLIFPGTVWFNSSRGFEVIPVLYCNFVGDGKWNLVFERLDRDWDDDSPFIHFVRSSEY